MGKKRFYTANKEQLAIKGSTRMDADFVTGGQIKSKLPFW